MVVTSDDPDASDKIAAFAAGRDPWLVAVRMVGEGVDIPRLRVGVYATTTTTDLFFRQAVGRFVRWVPGIRDQRAWLFIPDDPRPRIGAAEIAEQRRHSLRRTPREDDDGLGRGPEAEPTTGEQMSLFAALSAVAVVGSPYGPWHEPLSDEWSEGSDRSIELDLGPPPPIAASPDDGSGLTRRQAKDRLRAANAEAAKDIARVSGLSFAQVNLELNRQAGSRRVTEATESQLQTRLHVARRWQWRLGR